MEKLEITSMSSRGQVVIPLDIREHLSLKEGEKLMVLERGDMVILKKLQAPDMADFDRMLKKAQEHAKQHGLKPKDVEEAIKKVRGK